MFSQQLRQQPRAPFGSDLFDEKELRPERLRPHRCRLLGFGLPQGVFSDVRYLRVSNAVSSRFGLGSGVCPSLAAAKAAYDAPEYQEMLKLRQPHSNVSLSIIEEGDHAGH